MNEYKERRQMAQLSMWAFTLAKLKLDKDQKKILECKAKSHQVGKAKGKYRKKELRNARMK